MGERRRSIHRHGNRCVWHSSTHMPTNTRTTPPRRSVPARCVGLQHFSACFYRFFLPCLPCAPFSIRKGCTHSREREIDEGKRGSQFFFLLACFPNTLPNLTTNNVKFLYLDGIFFTPLLLWLNAREPKPIGFFFSSNHFCFHFGFHWVENYTKLCRRRSHSRWSFYGCVFDGSRLAWTWLAIFHYISGQSDSLSGQKSPPLSHTNG